MTLYTGAPQVLLLVVLLLVGTARRTHTSSRQTAVRAEGPNGGTGSDAAALALASGASVRAVPDGDAGLETDSAGISPDDDAMRDHSGQFVASDDDSSHASAEADDSDHDQDSHSAGSTSAASAADWSEAEADDNDDEGAEPSDADPISDGSSDVGSDRSG